MRNKMVIEIKGDTSNLNDVIASGYFRIGDTCVKVRGIERDIVKSLNPSTQDVKHVVVDCSTDDILSQPEFQNGDTVYHGDSNSLTYVSHHPTNSELSIVLREGIPLTAITSSLTMKPPVTPKDGEWWMCEFKGVHALYDVVQFTHDGWEAQPLHQPTDIKPLYRMIRDTDSE